MVRISRICKEDSLTGISYLVTWRKCFTAPRSNGWGDVLSIARLLFTVSVSNAKLDKMFSKLKRVKTNFYYSLGIIRLENILRIMEGGSS